MSNCTPCATSLDDFPSFCEPIQATNTAKRLIVEDDIFCQKALTSPTSYSYLVWNNGIKWSTELEGLWQQITTSYTAKNKDKLAVNTAAGIVTVTLPLSPNQFDEIVFADYGGTWGTNSLIILRNGSFIEGVPQDLDCDTTWPIQFTLRYQGSTWRVYEA